jgi:beta-galactosidase
VQPERLGPYCTTLNPGYDPSLPLYVTWPLFDAIRDASAEPPAPCKWGRTAAPKPGPAPTVPKVASAKVLSGPEGKLASELKLTGVPLAKLEDVGIPELLFKME